MHTIHFLTALNSPPGERRVTVRSGLKWSEFVEAGSVVNLCECERHDEAHPDLIEHLGGPQATIQSVWVGAFSQVPARWIELEHDESARSYSGILAAMRAAYGDDFNENDFCTALMYVAHPGGVDG